MADAAKTLRALRHIKDLFLFKCDSRAGDMNDAIAVIEGQAAELESLKIRFAKLAAKSSQQQAEIEREKEAARA